MLEAMRQLALDALWVELDEGKSSDPEVWYQELRAHDLGRLFPKLIEDIEQEGGKDKQRYYTLRADPQHTDIAVLQSVEFREGDSVKLPFNQASGPQAPALGPVIKRTSPSKAKDAGPTIKIQQTTLKAFGEIADAGRPWGPYFRAAQECFLRPKIEINGQVINAPGGALQVAIQLIDEKRTVLLVFQDELDRLPGQVPEYVDYLQEVLAKTKYATAQIPACEGKTCALCGHGPVKVYPKAPNGAGINLANLDREGAFPGLDSSAAWKGFSLCVSCADLLYVYCKHVADDYRATIAGHNALVIPSLQLDPDARKKFAKRLHEWIGGLHQAKDAVVVREKQLLNILGEEQVVTALAILWAEFGQRIDDIRGVVTDVLPSRLQKLVEFNRQIVSLECPVFPEQSLDDFQYNLPLTILKPLLRRPGGKAAEKSNDSRRLFDLRRDVAEAIYHASPLPGRFFDEAHETARWHFKVICGSGSPWALLNEGVAKDGKRFLTMAGWVRQLARFLHYLRLIGVPMPDHQELYQPSCEVLKPYFGGESAIRGSARAFAFILGVLYGKLLQVQAARGVNVGANALTWLKRLTLSGRDLSELYVKVREKMLAYEMGGNATVRQIVTELGELGAKLGANIQLDETETCYFLLLGQSLATKIIPSKQGKPGEGENHE
ncbi:MAG TPA: TM1802 family CRISPR-associated protein [Gemmataceae bacterium]|nr:TM1802 family CRISPR-associated protein [Gemmataceae bacterium]